MDTDLKPREIGTVCGFYRYVAKQTICGGFCHLKNFIRGILTLMHWIEERDNFLKSPSGARPNLVPGLKGTGGQDCGNVLL